MKLGTSCLAAWLVSLASCSSGLAASTFVTGVIDPPTLNSARLYGFEGESQAFSTNGGSAAAFHGTALLGDTVLVADYGSGSIRRFSLDGTAMADFASFADAVFLEVDRAGQVYTTHNGIGPSVATRFNSSGVITGTFTSPRAGSFLGIDADAAGNVYVLFNTGVGTTELQKYAADGTFLTSLPLPQGGFDLSIDDVGERLYMTSSDEIGVVDISGGTLVFDGAISAPAGSDIIGIHYAQGLGTLFVTDHGILSGDPRGMQLALDGTLLATYRPNDAELVFDIVHHVPEPTTWFLLLAGTLPLAGLIQRGR